VASLIASVAALTLAWTPNASAGVFAGVASAQEAPTGAALSGTVVNKAGVPLQRRLVLSLLGGSPLQHTTSTADGRFSFRVDYADAIARAGTENGNIVNWRIEVADGAKRWPYLTSTRWHPESRQWTRPRPEDGSEVRIVDPSVTASASMQAPRPGDLYGCSPDKGSKRFSYRSTPVGELNVNNDALGKFRYGVQKQEGTTFSAQGGTSKVKIAGDTTLAKSLSRELGTREFKRYVRYRASARVEFSRQRIEKDGGPDKGQLCYEEIAPTELLERAMTFRTRPRDEGGSASSCDRFAPAQRTVWPREADYTKVEGVARTLTRAVSAFGVGYQTQSNFTTNVTTYFKMGKRNLRHYLCGTGGSTTEGGQARPSTWSRIYGGT